MLAFYKKSAFLFILSLSLLPSASAQSGGSSTSVTGTVVDPTGAVVANAPRAEVGLSGMSLLTGHPRAESLNLVGAALSLRIESNGDVSVFTGVDKRPLARAPHVFETSKPKVFAVGDARANSVKRVASWC